MNELHIIKHKGVEFVDSREVADLIGKRHSDLLESIKVYKSFLLSGNFRSVDFFSESTYQDPTGRILPCYLLTKKGCDMVANKLTGQKGVQFTASYVTAFEKMREALTKPTCIEDVLIQSLQEMKEVKLQLQSTNARIDNISDLVSLNPSAWREETRQLIVKIAATQGGNEFIRDVQAEIHSLVDTRGGVSLSTRLTNKRQRMASEGVCKSKRDKFTKVDIIAEDKKLIEIYIAIVKETAIKYGVACRTVHPLELVN